MPDRSALTVQQPETAPQVRTDRPTDTMVPPPTPTGCGRHHLVYVIPQEYAELSPGSDASLSSIWSDGEHHSSPVRVRMAAKSGQVQHDEPPPTTEVRHTWHRTNPTHSTNAGEAEDVRAGRRKAARYVVPVAVMGVAAATIGLVPALADSGDPDLPKISAQQLIEKIAKSDVQQLSGTVKISTDLGLPDLGGLESSFASGRRTGSAASGGSSADPSSKLMELASGTHTLRVAADGPDKAQGLPPGQRRRVQRHPQRHGRVGLRQRVERGLPRDHARVRGTARSGRTSRPLPRSSPTRPSRLSTTPPP